MIKKGKMGKPAAPKAGKPVSAPKMPEVTRKVAAPAITPPPETMGKGKGKKAQAA